MIIAIDTAPLRSGHAERGIGTYTNNLVRALKKYYSSHTYIILEKGEPIPPSVDVVHRPYFDPFFLTLPHRLIKPTVVTVHDLIPIAYARHFPRGLRGELKWRIQKYNLSKANSILTDSHASKIDIMKFIKYPADDIYVIPLAASIDVTTKVEDSFLVNRKSKFHIPVHFILFVGDINWNKNIPGLIRSFQIIKKSPAISDHMRRSLKLVLVGRSFIDHNVSETQIIHSIINDLNLKNEIVMPGYIDTNQLAAYYAMSTCYVQPSYAEGFGLPVIDAMMMGSPTVVTNIPSLKEISGPSLVAVSPKSADIASKIIEVINYSPEKRQELIRESKQWASKFSWQKTAQQTLSVYEKAVSNVK